MGMNLHWRPRISSTRLSGTRSFLLVLDRVLDDESTVPRVLTIEDLKTLNIAFNTSIGTENEKPFKELIEAIVKFGEIELELK